MLPRPFLIHNTVYPFIVKVSKSLFIIFYYIFLNILYSNIIQIWCLLFCCILRDISVWGTGCICTPRTRHRFIQSSEMCKRGCLNNARQRRNTSDRPLRNDRASSHRRLGNYSSGKSDELWVTEAIKNGIYKKSSGPLIPSVFVPSTNSVLFV